MIQHTEIRDIIENFNEYTLSLYLHVDAGYIENQAEKPAWQIYLKNAISDVESSLQDNQTSQWDNLKEKLDTFFNNYTPSGRSLVLFVNEEQIYTHELPFMMANQSHFGKPYVSPLLWAMDEHEQYMVVLVDQERAKFYTAYLGNLETQTEMTINLSAYDWGEKTLMPASDSDGSALRQGNNREAFEDMISAHIDRFYNEVAEELQTVFQGSTSTRLIVGGDERIAHMLQDKLHESVSKYLVAILAIPMTASLDEIRDRITEPAYNYERDYEFELVENIMSQAYAEGRGALGRETIETKMKMQQIELLVISKSLLQAEPDYAHEITMWALNNNVSIEFVHGQAARKLESHDGIAARLYYSMETA